MSCGGLSESKPATSEIQEICNKIKGTVESKTATSYSKFEAIRYTTQVVAGTNYFILVDVGDTFIHVRVYESLPYAGKQLEVHGVRQNVGKEDPIVHFG